MILVFGICELAPRAARSDISTSVSPRFESGFQKLGLARQSEFWLQGTIDYEDKGTGGARRSRWTGRLSLQYDVLVSDFSGPQRLNESGSPLFLEDREAYLETSRGLWIWAFGSKLLRYGVLDIYDPLDQVNSRRFENPLSSDKRGEWMLHVQRRTEQLTLEAFLIPEKRSAILPSVKSRWLPRKLYVPALPTSEFVLPENLEYSYNGTNSYNGARQWAYGARIAKRWGETEVSLQYDEGSANFPSLEPQVTGTVVETSPRQRVVVDPLIQLKTLETRERHFGGSVVTTLFDTLLRLQVAKTEPLYKGREVSRDRVDFGLALEKTFGSWTALAQGFYNSLKPKETGNDIAALTGLFDEAISLGVRYGLSETSAITLGVLNSLAHESNRVVLAGYNQDLSDSLQLGFNASLIEGGERSPLGTFDGNDTVSVKLTWLH